jgi:hypothetical protein
LGCSTLWAFFTPRLCSLVSRFTETAAEREDRLHQCTKCSSSLFFFLSVRTFPIARWRVAVCGSDLPSHVSQLVIALAASRSPPLPQALSRSPLGRSSSYLTFPLPAGRPHQSPFRPSRGDLKSLGADRWNANLLIFFAISPCADFNSTNSSSFAPKSQSSTARRLDLSHSTGLIKC